MKNKIKFFYIIIIIVLIKILIHFFASEGVKEEKFKNAAPSLKSLENNSSCLPKIIEKRLNDTINRSKGKAIEELLSLDNILKERRENEIYCINFTECLHTKSNPFFGSFVSSCLQDID